MAVMLAQLISSKDQDLHGLKLKKYKLHHQLQMINLVPEYQSILLMALILLLVQKENPLRLAVLAQHMFSKLDKDTT